MRVASGRASVEACVVVFVRLYKQRWWMGSFFDQVRAVTWEAFIEVAFVVRTLNAIQTLLSKKKKEDATSNQSDEICKGGTNSLEGTKRRWVSRCMYILDQMLAVQPLPKAAPFSRWGGQDFS